MGSSIGRVDPGDFATFLAIARHKSFRRAASELGVTPSALSHALRVLEERVGLRLVNRTTRSVALTEVGERLHARLKPILLDLDAAFEELNVYRTAPVGTLKINAPRLAARLMLLPIVTRFLEAYPAVHVEVVVDEAFVDVVSAGFDAGVRYGELIAADMLTVPCGGRHRFAVVGSPSYFATRPVPRTPHELGQHRCIRYRFASGAFYRWEFEKRGVELAVEVNGSLTVGDQDLMVEPALAGAGLAYVFEEQVAEHLEAGRLVRALADWCPAYPGFFLYYPSRRQLPAALRAFVDFFRAEDAASKRAR
jgi:DNA-binding transcriptional LysR family regulator